MDPTIRSRADVNNYISYCRRWGSEGLADLKEGELIKADIRLLANICAPFLKYDMVKYNSLIQKFIKIIESAHFHPFNDLPGDLKQIIGKYSDPNTAGRLALTSKSNYALQNSPVMIAAMLSRRYLVQPIHPRSEAYYYEQDVAKYTMLTDRNKADFLKRLRLAGQHLKHVHFQDIEFTLEELKSISEICPKIQKISGLNVDFYGPIPQLPRPMILALISVSSFIGDGNKEKFLKLIQQAGPDATLLNLKCLPLTLDELQFILENCPNIKKIKGLRLKEISPNQPLPFSPDFCAQLISMKLCDQYSDAVQLKDFFSRLIQHAGNQAIHINFSHFYLKAHELRNIFSACPNIQQIQNLNLSGAVLEGPSKLSLPTSLENLDLNLYEWVDKIFHVPMLQLKFLNLRFPGTIGKSNFLEFTPNLESLTLENWEAKDPEHAKSIFDTLAKLKNLHTLKLIHGKLQTDNKLPVKTLILKDCSVDFSIFPCLKMLRLEGHLYCNSIGGSSYHGVSHSGLSNIKLAQTVEKICLTHPSEEAVYTLLTAAPNMPNLKTIYIECDRNEYDQAYEWIDLYLPDSGDLKVVISEFNSENQV